MGLTSIDYARLISWIAYFKHQTILNKTQLQKLLFICYGLYLADHDSPLFDDDTPKAWPFGPVFPRSYKRYVEQAPSNLSEDEKKAYLENRDALRMVTNVVDLFYSIPANILSDWSHRPGSPWAQTVFTGNNKFKGWNNRIEDSTISEFFKNQSWRVGL